MANLVVYTDASIVVGIASWAAVWHFDGEQMTAGALFSDDGWTCPATAELSAMGCAMHVIIGYGHVAKGDVVTIFTDSNAAIHYMNNPDYRRPKSGYPTGRRAKIRQAADYLVSLAERHVFSVSVKKVRGHVRSDLANHHERFNREADRIAREISRAELMRRRRAAEVSAA